MDISDLRREYQQRPLRRAALLKDPFEQFKLWLEEAVKSEEIEPNAMALATVDKEGRPSCRHVLLKAIDTGFIFFTNLNSRKALHMDERAYAAGTFWWRHLERQVTLEGIVEGVERETAADYFAKRPRASQLAAWASEKQSAAVESRKVLEEKYERIEEQFKKGPVPLPPFWGGFRLVPNRFEFWQGRPNRLHDRFLYLKSESGWTIERLSP